MGDRQQSEPPDVPESKPDESLSKLLPVSEDPQLDVSELYPDDPVSLEVEAPQLDESLLEVPQSVPPP